jgi:ubiquitin carboxyl-terminal hydrolase 9/24
MKKFFKLLLFSLMIIFKIILQAPQNFTPAGRSPLPYYRNNVINQLQTSHSIVMLVAQNLSAYMNNGRVHAKEFPEEEPGNILPDGRFNHIQQVQERLKFLR